MARITVAEAKAWCEPTKLTFTTLDAELLAHMEEEVIDRLRGVQGMDVNSWTDSTTTPKLVRTIISKKYVAFLYMRQYSEDVGTQENTYALKLDANAEMLIAGILDGSIEIPGTISTTTDPAYYPTDASSAQDPTDLDPSLGPAKFSMTTVF